MKLGITNWDYIKVYPAAEAYRIMKGQGYDYADYQQFINTESDFFKSPLAEFERAITNEKKIAADAGLTNGYRIINNCGEDGCQTVKHIHFHILGGKKLPENMG